MEKQLVGASRALRQIDHEINLIAPVAAKVLITGEPGVGKDLIARLIHQRSQRTGPFLTINCAAVPEAVLESELFGHASGPLAGWLEQARQGTVFLDNVDQLPLHVQAHLLRFLEHSDQRGGPDCPQSASNIRVITATSQNLLERVAMGGFREDLYYRLNVIHLVIPPLRERPEDVAPLITHFLETYSAARQMPRPVLSEEGLAKLTAYAWPGNVAELANVMERLVLRGVTPVSPADLPIAIARGPVWSAPGMVGRSTAYGRYAPTEDGTESFWPVTSPRGADRRLLRRRH